MKAKQSQKIMKFEIGRRDFLKISVFLYERVRTKKINIKIYSDHIVVSIFLLYFFSFEAQ